MTLDVIIFFIVLLPIVLLVILRRGKDLRANASQVLGEILGAFLLVCGLLLLFVAFYLLFHEKTTGLSVGLLVVSLSLVFGGYAMTKRTSQKSKSGWEGWAAAASSSWPSSKDQAAVKKMLSLLRPLPGHAHGLPDFIAACVARAAPPNGVIRPGPPPVASPSPDRFSLDTALPGCGMLPSV